MGTHTPLQKGGGTPFPQFSAHFYYGQTAGCLKMPLVIQVGLSPGDFCVRWALAPSPKNAQPPIFGACLLLPNGCMDQDATWYGDGPRPRRLCLMASHPLPKKGAEHALQFSAHFYCGQTTVCIKMSLGMEVGLSPGDFVLDGDPAPPQKGGGSAYLHDFRPMSIVAKRLDGSRWHLAW